ncbi:transferase [Aureococcus anophagefferens]|nr:transferase [Aureococcus anophagefferens]
MQYRLVALLALRARGPSSPSIHEPGPGTRPNTLVDGDLVEAIRADVRARAASSDETRFVVLFDDELSPEQQRNLEKRLQVESMDDLLRASGAPNKKALAMERQYERLARGDVSGGASARAGEQGRARAAADAVRGSVAARPRPDGAACSRSSRGGRRRGRPFAAPRPSAAAAAARASRCSGDDEENTFFIDDKPFATLDPLTLRVGLRTPSRECLVTDTVGFVAKLPAQVVAAFRATLEEVADADVLVHVVDATASEDAAARWRRRCRPRSRRAGAGATPRLLFYNKCDALAPDDRERLRKAAAAAPNAFAGSRDAGRARRARDAAADVLDDALCVVRVALPYADPKFGALLTEVKTRGRVDDAVHGDDADAADARNSNLQPDFNRAWSSLLSWAASLWRRPNDRARFDAWMRDAVKVDAGDYERRLDIFAEKLRSIEAHDSSDFRLGLNRFSHLTEDEFASMYRRPMSRVPAPPVDAVAPAHRPRSTGSPRAPWTPTSRAPARRAGRSRRAAPEGAFALATGRKGANLTAFSQQQIAEATTSRGTAPPTPAATAWYGMDSAYAYIETNGGLCTEAAYPYVGANSTDWTTCHARKRLRDRVRSAPANHTDVAPASEAALAAAVAKQPVSVVVDASCRASVSDVPAGDAELAVVPGGSRSATSTSPASSLQDVKAPARTAAFFSSFSASGDASPVCDSSSSVDAPRMLALQRLQRPSAKLRPSSRTPQPRRGRCCSSSAGAFVAPATHASPRSIRRSAAADVLAPAPAGSVTVEADADAVGKAVWARVEAAAKRAIDERGRFARRDPGGSVLKMLEGTRRPGPLIRSSRT